MSLVWGTWEEKEERWRRVGQEQDEEEDDEGWSGKDAHLDAN